MTACQQCRKYLTKITQLQKELKEYRQESQDAVGRLEYTIKESNIVKQMKRQLAVANKRIAELKQDKQELMQNVDEAVKIAEYYKAKLQHIRTPKYNPQTQLAKEHKRIQENIRKLYEETRPEITLAKKIQYPDKPTSLPATSHQVSTHTE